MSSEAHLRSQQKAKVEGFLSVVNNDNRLGIATKNSNLDSPWSPGCALILIINGLQKFEESNFWNAR